MTVKDNLSSYKSGRNSDRNLYSPDEWYELESDPGLFTLLLEDFGVHGVQVEEIYEIQKPPPGVVFGFIFLFKWQDKEKKKSRRSHRSTITDCNTDSQVIDIDANNLTSLIKDEQQIFFANQMVPNSCATHALLSILLNQSESIDIGSMLKEFLHATKGHSPKVKGLAIGYMPQLAHAHNRHASAINRGSFGDFNYKLQCEDPEFFYRSAKNAVETALNVSAVEESPSKSGLNESSTSSNSDTFHFICFVPIYGHLYELDGLKSGPVNHGPLRNSSSLSDWTEQCFNVLRHRMNEKDSYNLMAVVPDKCAVLNKKIAHLKKNHNITLETLKRLKTMGPITVSTPLSSAIHEIRKDMVRSNSRNPSGDSNISTSKLNIKTDSDFTEMSKELKNYTKINASDEIYVEYKNASSHCSTENPESRQPLSVQVASGSCSDCLTEKSDFQIQKPESCTGSDSSDESENWMSFLTSASNTFTIADLWRLLDRLRARIRQLECALKDEDDRRTSFRIDDARRVHDYQPFIREYLLALQRHGLLSSLIEKHQKNSSSASSPQINGPINSKFESPIAVHSTNINRTNQTKKLNDNESKLKRRHQNSNSSINPVIKTARNINRLCVEPAISNSENIIVIHETSLDLELEGELKNLQNVEVVSSKTCPSVLGSPVPTITSPVSGIEPILIENIMSSPTVDTELMNSVLIHRKRSLRQEQRKKNAEAKTELVEQKAEISSSKTRRLSSRITAKNGSQQISDCNGVITRRLSSNSSSISSNRNSEKSKGK